MGVEIWVHFEVWERKRRLCWVVAFAEKGLLSEGVLDHDVRIVIDEIGSFCECFAVLCWWLLSDSVLILLWMGMQCGCFVMWYGVDFTRFGGNDHHFEFPPFWLNFHHFTCSSSLFPCLHSDNTLSNNVEWVLWWMGSRCVAQREESGTSRWSVELVLKSSDVYSWERDEVSTILCDVSFILKCIFWRKIHIGETGHV